MCQECDELADVDRLVAAAEKVLLLNAYMECKWGSDWAELEHALEPYRADCACGMKKAPLMHHDSAPYFCGLSEPGGESK